jgi:hypothetical protein
MTGINITFTPDLVFQPRKDGFQRLSPFDSTVRQQKISAAEANLVGTEL